MGGMEKEHLLYLAEAGDLIFARGLAVYGCDAVAPAAFQVHFMAPHLAVLHAPADYLRPGHPSRCILFMCRGAAPGRQSQDDDTVVLGVRSGLPTLLKEP